MRLFCREVAVTVTQPVCLAVSRPSAVMLARDLLLTRHVTYALASEGVGVALHCSVSPRTMTSVEGVMVSERGVAF